MSEKEGGRTWIWAVLLLEGMILLLAVIGPGRRHPDPTLIARFFLDDPSFLQAVGVNWIALHVVIVGALFAAWIVKRRKRAEAARRGETADPL